MSIKNMNYSYIFISTNAVQRLSQSPESNPTHSAALWLADLGLKVGWERTAPQTARPTGQKGILRLGRKSNRRPELIEQVLQVVGAECLAPGEEIV